MSLIIEQQLDGFFFSEAEPKIYTTGAHLVPMKVKHGEKERYVWVVSDFDDDSYLDGELCSPVVYADNLNNLMS